MYLSKKSLASGIVMIIMIIALVYSGYIPFDQYIERQVEAFNQINKKSSTSFGYIQPQVVNGFTEEPLQGAQIVIPEINKTFITNSQGQTERIKVPILVDEHFSSLHPKSWGEITLIVYKEGYNEYVLFHTHVWENQNRQGPKILLFPKENNRPNEPISIVEGPHRLWVNSLVEKFRP